MPDVLILGPQFRSPNLREALALAGVEGPLAIVTAGWQEREGELGPLEEHLGAPVRDLRLYERAEAVFTHDRELRDAHRARQERLRRLQDLYRVRLEHAKRAARELFAGGPEDDLMDDARRAAVSTLQRLDAAHLKVLQREHARFDEQFEPHRRPVVAAQREEISHVVEHAAAVCIAGGHIAVLLNRLRLFDAARLFKGKTVVAWSAGAMALGERVVLFHDHPPQGAGNAELFEAGLSFVPHTVFLPHATSRLALDEPPRVALFARRFSPAACLTLDDGSLLHWRRGVLRRAVGAKRLRRDGSTLPVSRGA